jgi:hypothetical protein
MFGQFNHFILLLSAKIRRLRYGNAITLPHFAGQR